MKFDTDVIFGFLTLIIGFLLLIVSFALMDM